MTISHATVFQKLVITIGVIDNNTSARGFHKLVINMGVMDNNTSATGFK